MIAQVLDPPGPPMGPPMGGPDARRRSRRPWRWPPGVGPRPPRTGPQTRSPKARPGASTPLSEPCPTLSRKPRRRAASTWWSSSRGISRLGGLLGRPMLCRPMWFRSGGRSGGSVFAHVRVALMAFVACVEAPSVSAGVARFLAAKNNPTPEAVGRFLMAAVGQFRVATNNSTDGADQHHGHVVQEAAAREPDRATSTRARAVASRSSCVATA